MLLLIRFKPSHSPCTSSSTFLLPLFNPSHHPFPKHFFCSFHHQSKPPSPIIFVQPFIDLQVASRHEATVRVDRWRLPSPFMNCPVVRHAPVISISVQSSSPSTIVQNSHHNPFHCPSRSFSFPTVCESRFPY